MKFLNLQVMKFSLFISLLLFPQIAEADEIESAYKVVV